MRIWNNKGNYLKFYKIFYTYYIIYYAIKVYILQECVVLNVTFAKSNNLDRI